MKAASPVMEGARDPADVTAVAGHLTVLAAHSRIRQPEGRERELLVRAIARLAGQLHGIQEPRVAPKAETEERPNEGPANYPELVARVQDMAANAVPSGSRVAIISRGDEELLQLPERVARHFPAGPDGRYAGFYPADGNAALEQLQKAVAGGARYLVIPETGRWWLDYYVQFADFLRGTCRLLVDQPNTGVIFELPSSPVGSASSSLPIESRQEADPCELAHVLLRPKSRFGLAVASEGRVQLREYVTGRQGAVGVHELEGDPISALRSTRIEAVVVTLPTPGELEPLVHLLDRELRPIVRREAVCAIFDVDARAETEYLQ